ncbi:hypothetical protein PSGK_08320 [Pseudomonas solani]|uniref:hypothetical protein n=1 Tax=Pseudomonas solani TaxID=2731552 RepID=UPI0035BE1F3E
MQWIITYRINNEVRYLAIKTRGVPNSKAVAFAIYTTEFPDKPCPSISRDSVKGWLEASGINLLDVQLRHRN